MRQRPRELMKERTLRFFLVVQFETLLIIELLGLRFKSIDTEHVQFRASLVVGMCLATISVSRVLFLKWNFVTYKHSLVSPPESLPPNVVSALNCVDKFEVRRQVPFI